MNFVIVKLAVMYKFGPWLHFPIITLLLLLKVFVSLSCDPLPNFCRFFLIHIIMTLAEFSQIQIVYHLIVCTKCMIYSNFPSNLADQSY